MKKVAFVFPGQGAQYVGMGKELACNYKEAMEIFDIACEKLGLDMKKLCFDSNPDILRNTEITQPAIYTVSVAILNVVKKMGVSAYASAGLSLGEYAALVAAGAIDFGETISLVRKRGLYMQQNSGECTGSMAAVMGLDRSLVYNYIQEINVAENIVEIANYNCPGQVVISGSSDAVKKACDGLHSLGAKNIVPLSVNAPFHSSLMRPVAEKFAKEMENISIHDCDSIKFLSSVTGNVISDSEAIRTNLIKQIYSPVLWEDVIVEMLDLGINTFVEIGPGKTLTNLIKTINRDVETLSVQDQKTLDAACLYINDL